ncbi:hypothetical protein [Streptomyces antibioticus]|uniref:hypothetical protein n=1 Tax=Streptomyces antibioticus TaxID=1890 RepID=UPI00225995FE|nr:hypothetical protein [Streptomyces antibioticus]MCX4741215.1 hypothetical protein [Streptomyces antibioticus]
MSTRRGGATRTPPPRAWNGGCTAPCPNRRLGVPRDRLAVRGVGATWPKRPEILPDGAHDLSAARENRRVVIEPTS